jgi:hypothetical protein
MTVCGFQKVIDCWLLNLVLPFVSGVQQALLDCGSTQDWDVTLQHCPTFISCITKLEKRLSGVKISRKSNNVFVCSLFGTWLHYT